MNETETVSTRKAGSGISMEELSATDAWRSLGPNLKRLLTVALQSRNLSAAIREFNPQLDAETQRQLAENLLREPAVRRVIDLYTVGIAAPLPAETSVVVRPVVVRPVVVPVTDGEVFSQAEQVN